MIDVGDSETDLGCAELGVRLASHVRKAWAFSFPSMAGMVGLCRRQKECILLSSLVASSQH